MGKLNENDKKLLALCRMVPLPINEISRRLNISPASVSVRVKKLEESGLVIVERKGRGKKVEVRTKKAIKIDKFMKDILAELKKVKNGMTIREYENLLGGELGDEDLPDKLKAKNYVLYSFPPLTQMKIFITLEGLKFLKKTGN